MRIFAAAAAAVMVAVTNAGIAGPAAAAWLSVAIVSLPVSAPQGGVEHVNALVLGGTACSLSVRYSGGLTQTLGAKRVIADRVAWTWRIGLDAAPGSAVVTVACARAGRARGSFTVQRRLVPATIEVVKSGLTQVPHSYDNGTDISYGIVLVNKSADEDALDVQVAVNLLDGSNRVIGTDTAYIAAVPAGATYYLGGEVTTHDRTQVVGVQPLIVGILDSKPKSVLTPVVTNVRVTAHTYDSGAYVDGQVTNQASGSLSSFAEITAVFFDGVGNVVGGGVAFPPFALPPGASAAFEIITSVPASAIATIQISVEPRYGA